MHMLEVAIVVHLTDGAPADIAGDGQVTVTLVAAAIGGVAAIAAAVLGVVNAWHARRWTSREQWWTRFTWACEKSVSEQPAEADVGLKVLTALIDAPWGNAQDNRMSATVAGFIMERGVRKAKEGRR